VGKEDDGLAKPSHGKNSRTSGHVSLSGLGTILMKISEIYSSSSVQIRQTRSLDGGTSRYFLECF
jgi:hypothetical protein